MKAFDKSRIPHGKRNDPALLEEEARLMHDLQDADYRFACCIHEAAHGVCLRRAGAKRLIYQPPHAIHHAEKDTFDTAFGAIGPDFGSGPIPMVSQIQVARWHVAGGVAERNMTTSKDPHDGKDRDDFVNKIHSFWSETSDAEIEKLWEQATRDVEADLKNPEVQQEILELAREFEKWLLGE